MKAITLFDGGLGQEIHLRSQKPAHPLWAINVMLEQPQIVQEVHQDFIDAGCNILTLNTYTATPSRLKRDAFDKDNKLLKSINDIAIKLAKKSLASSTQVQIAGCLPPLVASYRTDVCLNYEESLAEYKQIVSLQQDHIDFFLCETMSSIVEAIAATKAAKDTNKAVIVAFSLREDESLCLRSGEPLENAVAAILPFNPVGVMLNCSTPETISYAMPTFATIAQKNQLRFGAYANGFTSIDALKPGGTVDSLIGRVDLSADKYADIVEQWITQGATLIGRML